LLLILPLTRHISSNAAPLAQLLGELLTEKLADIKVSLRALLVHPPWPGNH
jgi:hypothetical protein